jgi:hypothetical protein
VKPNLRGQDGDTGSIFMPGAADDRLHWIKQSSVLRAYWHHAVIHPQTEPHRAQSP